MTSSYPDFILKKDTLLCYGCKACEQKCPTLSIKMVPDNEGFYYPQIDKEKCINCRLCRKVCPHNENAYKKNNEFKKVFACIHKDDMVKFSSSSGGLFTALSDYVIDSGGIVFGAKYNESFDVEHSYAENKIAANAFKCSKYVQSDIKNTYKQTEEFLKKDKLVLFSGTPCQIAGLYSFLMRDYDNLVTVDLVCHGVPSPKVFKEYLKYVSNKYNSKIKYINFKEKSSGWLTPTINIKFENNSCYSKRLSDDIFIKLWSGMNLISRPACHNCKFTKTDRESDITIGDFWGIQNSMPDFMDDMGTSLLILNTSKGEKIFNKIKSRLKIRKSNIESIENPNLFFPTPVGVGRKNFFRDFNCKPFKYIVFKYNMMSIIIKIINKIKTYLVILKFRHSSNFMSIS